ncbi:hypothetical protein SEA_TEACUP_35 [Arthrobacter phage Teacup]|uniref:Uncharacterized protein n=1 Tax=Arthrobacter phage Teacup TaxID=2015871 RepID=A0A222ZJ31_9CAUD|nr:hypothetical protein QCN31_gp35 [Arthrobacter phage Teacup]ASR84040.1 hypothetical protein SEA_TEACUP_35 [Arthrobacter phage Teacup]
MNKKMENLYAEINTLFRWADDLFAEHEENPESFADTDLITKIGNRIIDLTYDLDIARIEYHNQPLWKRLLKK